MKETGDRSQETEVRRQKSGVESCGVRSFKYYFFPFTARPLYPFSLSLFPFPKSLFPLFFNLQPSPFILHLSGLQIVDDDVVVDDGGVERLQVLAVVLVQE